MRQLPSASAFLPALALFAAGIAPAHADIRDASLGIEGNTALSLIEFDGQPGTVRINQGHEGLEVFIQGVRAKPARIIPPDTHLVSAIDVEAAQGGVLLRYWFSDLPDQASAEVYDHAVLLRATFDHSPGMQKRALSFANTAKPVSHSAPAKTVNHIAEPAPVKAVNHSAEPADNAPKSDGDVKVPRHDGDVRAPAPAPSPAPVKPKAQGVGMVRDAAHEAIPDRQGLSEETCAAAQAAIEEDPWALDKLSLYGSCIAKDGKTEDAKEVFERLLTFDPDMVSAYMGLGAINQETGDADAAKRFYQQALALGGSDSEAAHIREMLNTLGDNH